MVAQKQQAAEVIERQERGTLALLRQIQSGEVVGRLLGPDERRRVVEHLVIEGYSSPEIAEVLGVAERTIARDRAAIREANAIDPDPDLAPQTVGRLVQYAEHATARLRRLARDRSCPAQTRVEAERAAWQILADLTRLLQRLGWLPETASRVHAQVSLIDDDSPPEQELEALLVEAARLEAIARGVGAAPEVTGRLAAVRDVTTRRALAAAIDETKRTVNQNGGKDANEDD